MPKLNITQHRLSNQQLTSPRFKKPEDVVTWMGAVQAQEYYGAMWALALRMSDPTDAVIEKAFTEGKILRTHVMRPTWHYVTPADIRWLLQLTAPRVFSASRSYFRKLELDDAVLRVTNRILKKALKGGKYLTRDVLQRIVREAGIGSDSIRFGFILMRAELDGLICSGPRQGKQLTYGLLEERVPTAKSLTHDEALAELTRRYFTSHGPATLQDFGWWSGLSVAQTKVGVELVGKKLIREVVDDQVYWLPASAPPVKRSAINAWLLPTYDEYLIAYKDRSAAIDISNHRAARADTEFTASVVYGGRAIGRWKRTLSKESVNITVRSYATLGVAEKRAAMKAAQRYGEFIQLAPVVSFR